MKIYTRTGDAGETGLLGAKRVRKNVLRVEAYGAVDELNACIGVTCAALDDPELLDLLHAIQRDLFAVGTRLADVRKRKSREGKIILERENVRTLERAIDRFDETIPALTQFILPGGCEAGARLHQARTVCRRAERRVAALAEKERVPPVLLAYMNRLSDLLFVLARSVNHRAGAKEILW